MWIKITEFWSFRTLVIQGSQGVSVVPVPSMAVRLNYTLAMEEQVRHTSPFNSSSPFVIGA